MAIIGHLFHGSRAVVQQSRTVIAVFVGLLLSLLTSVGVAAPAPAMHWSLLEDPSGQLTLEEMRGAAFRPLPTAQFAHPATAGALWLHGTLPPLDESRWLWLFIPKAQEVDYHLLKDRKSTRLNSSHVKISYAVFCLKKKNKTEPALHPRM